MTFDPQFEFSPVWSPDGKAIYYNGNRDRRVPDLPSLGRRSGRGGRHLEGKGLSQSPYDITPDGRQLVFGSQEPQTGFDLWILDTAGGTPPVPYPNTATNDLSARLSPDGRWIAYVLNENGRDEVYVQSFPTPGSKVQVSNGGADASGVEAGRQAPLLPRPGRVAHGRGRHSRAALRVAAPVKLFRFPRKVRFFDIAPDGQRVLASMSASDAAGRTIGVILDWDAQTGSPSQDPAPFSLTSVL